MKTKTIIIGAILSLVILTACHDETGYFREAEAGLEQGRQHIADKQTEAAAQNLSQALLAIDRCDPTKPEVQRLKGLIEDNLGFAYWKHELFDEALPLHTDAAQLFRALGNDTLLMNALRNCGRTAASMGDINAAQQHYDEALQLAQKLNDKTMERELLLDSSLDVLMAKEDYGQVIERVGQALDEGADADACHLTLGLAHYYLSHDSLAIVHLNEATRSDKAGVRMSAYQSLYYLHQFAGNYQKALECHERFNDNMMQADREHRSEQVQRIKAEYDLQMQKNNLEAEQKLKSLYLYLILGHPWRPCPRFGHRLVAATPKNAECQTESRGDEEPIGAGTEEKQGVRDRPRPHRANHGLNIGLRPQGKRMGRLRDAHRQGLRRLHKKADRKVPHPHQERPANLLPHQTRLQQPGDFDPDEPANQQLCTPQIAHQAGEDEWVGRRAEF